MARHEPVRGACSALARSAVCVFSFHLISKVCKLWILCGKTCGKTFISAKSVEPKNRLVGFVQSKRVFHRIFPHRKSTTWTRSFYVLNPLIF